MLEQHLLEERLQRPAPEDDDERRRYYRITPFGEVVARAEIAAAASWSNWRGQVGWCRRAT